MRRIIIIGALCLAHPFACLAQLATEAARVDKAIVHLMALAPGSEVRRDAVYRERVALAIVEAGRAHDVPALLLATMAYRESSFRPRVIGARGEIGITQIMPRWRLVHGCDLDTVEGQLECTARMVADYHERCGSWERALVMYASGTCEASEAVERGALSRVRQWRRLEER